MRLRLPLAAAALCLAWRATAASTPLLPDLQTLSGDTRFACEALLCLAAPQRPSECAAAISRYFRITASRPDRLIRRRLAFLNLCPTSSASSQMRDYAHTLAQGAGRCDAIHLNARLQMPFGVQDGADRMVIQDRLPADCQQFFAHDYVQQPAPRYVGLPLQGGYWVEASDYAQALDQWAQTRRHHCQQRAEHTASCLAQLDAVLRQSANHVETAP